MQLNKPAKKSIINKFIFGTAGVILAAAIGYGTVAAQNTSDTGTGYVTENNTNNINVSNSNNQNASTGNATVSGNTNGGNATSGNASNSNTTNTNITVTN